MAFAFTPDGKVEARNDKGSLFGTWWLEAGNLNVPFGELGIQSWPWREAAAHIGFEVPQRSLTPWTVVGKADSEDASTFSPNGQVEARNEKVWEAGDGK